MTWVRLDEHFARHPKVVAAGPVGMAMQVAALCYCNEYLTDGLVPHAIVPGLLTIDKPGAIVEKLVEVGLWEKAEGGWRVHDFHDYQPTKVEVLALREARSAAGAKGGKAKAKGVASAKQVLKQNASNGSSKTASKRVANLYPVPVPVPTTPSGLKYILDTWLANAPPLIVHRPTIATSTKTQKAAAKAVDSYGLDDVKTAVVNYAIVLGSEMHYFSHKWTLPDFLNRGLPRFVPEAEPLENFKASIVNGRDRGMTFEQILAMGGDDGGQRTLGVGRES